jgi:hypothetical protein
MFTLEQIKKAHDKVQTGSDFPIYIQELIDLGVEYDTLLVVALRRNLGWNDKNTIK